MKGTTRWVAVALAGATALAISPAHAGGQLERGIVFAPHVGRVGRVLVETCPGVADAVVGWATQRSIHASFPVKSSTWGRPFSLTSVHPAADLSISFRKPGYIWVRFEEHRLGIQEGTVPSGAIEAVVCLALGAPTRFTYRVG